MLAMKLSHAKNVYLNGFNFMLHHDFNIGCHFGDHSKTVDFLNFSSFRVVSL